MGKKIFLAVTALILLFSFFYYVYSFVYYPSRIHTVVEGKFYRSGQLSEEQLQRTIKEKGIKTIINLRGKFSDTQWYSMEAQLTGQHDIKLYDIGISPRDLPRYRKLIKLTDIILASEKPVLIHCYKGADRSGMVSALALAIELDPPFSELKKQFSFRYGVLPFLQSVGPYFFSLYEDWLNKTHKTHNKDNLLYWIKHEYQDDYGNLEFWIDQINDTHWSKFEDKKIKIPRDGKNITIYGWAFDAGTNSPVKFLHVTIDNQLSFKTHVVHNRPNVAKYFNLGDQYYQNFTAGWEVTVNRTILSSGCHTLFLRYFKNESIWDIPTEIIFCIE